jgi:hypothetical protein
MLRPLALVLLCSFVPACMKAPDPEIGLRQATEQAEPAQSTKPTVVLPAMDGWQETATTLEFQVGRWDLPGGGVATISWLGPSKDSMAMNLDRWLGQWQKEDGQPAQDGRIEPDAEGNYPFTFVRVAGILTDTRQVGGGEPRADWVLLGAIVDAPGGPLYVKAVGPEAELGDQTEDFRAAVRAIQVNR